MITKEYLQQELAKRIDGYKRGVETTTDNIIMEMKSILVLVDALPDYEKKYNEALNDMRAIYPNLKGDAKLAVEHAFPELRESEDERIRKWLVDYFGSIKEVVWIHRDITCEQILEWLEKQKESHIPWYDYQKSKEAGYTIVPNEEYEQLIKQKEQKPQVFCEAKAYDLGYKQGKEDAIKEQKPAEWSEEDESELTAIIYCVSQAIKASKDENERNSLLSAKKWLQDKLSFRVKSLRPSWKPSEEQMKALEIAFRKDGDDKYRSTINSLYNDLKKL